MPKIKEKEEIKMTDKLWKRAERKIAKIFGTTRTPLSGGNSMHTMSDSLHPSLFLEVKTRKKIPFLKTYKETIEKAKKENKIPLVVFVEKSSKTPIVMCDIHNLKKIAEFVKDD